MTHTKTSFGRDVLGPIFAEFALRLWIYLSNLDAPEQTALLFCARGGLRLQLVYDRFLAASGLVSPVHASPLMVSRVVAVRPALLAGAESAFAQIDYEFSGNSLFEVAAAVSGIGTGELEGPESWRAPYTRQGLRDLLASSAGQPVLQRIRQQVDLFRTHLSLQPGGRTHVVLCDTGLFGSTLQLLMDGVPDLTWSAVMLARSNYKHQPAPHFNRTTGLSVEADHYAPWNPRTAVLRYWQLIEAICEPDLPSVTGFTDHNGTPRSNLEACAWTARVQPEPGSIFAGIVAYIDTLQEPAALTVVADAQVAWRVLQRTLAWPRAHEAAILDAGQRSDDFGRETAPIVARSWHGPLAALRGRSMWREGEIARSGSPLRMPLLLGIEAAYSLRWCSNTLRRRAR